MLELASSNKHGQEKFSLGGLAAFLVVLRKPLLTRSSPGYFLADKAAAN